MIKNIQENAYDDTAIQNAIKALQEADLLKADKTQVATDIATAVAAEAEIARAAEKANADEIARVDAALKLAIDDEDGKGLNSIKDLATWIEEHGEDAAEMSAAITKNAEDIAAMDKAYKAADEAIDGRLDVIEAALGEGEGSVADQIADAKDAAIAAANSYTDGEINKLGDLAKKNEADLDLKALAHKDSATGTVAGQTISGVKANGKSAGSISVALEQSEHAMNSTGKFTPAGQVAGTVTIPEHNVPVALTRDDAAVASVNMTEASYTAPVSLAKNDVAVVTSATEGTQASFTEGKFTPASLTYAAANYNVAKEGLVGAVNEDECLVFTAAGLEAISASKISAFDGGSKAADTFVANSLPTFTTASAIASITEATAAVKYDKVSSVTYSKVESAAGTCAGNVIDIAATFTGTEGDIAVAGKCHDYAVKTAEFIPADIELAVGDIAVAEKTVTVQ